MRLDLNDTCWYTNDQDLNLMYRDEETSYSIGCTVFEPVEVDPV